MISFLFVVQVLDLSSNSLRTFPSGPCKLELNILDLSSNELSSLPPEMGLMTSLRKLPLDGNPLRTIRRELIAGLTAFVIFTFIHAFVGRMNYSTVEHSLMQVHFQSCLKH